MDVLREQCGYRSSGRQSILKEKPQTCSERYTSRSTNSGSCQMTMWTWDGLRCGSCPVSLFRRKLANGSRSWPRTGRRSPRKTALIYLEIAEAATEVAGRLVFGEPKTHRRKFVQLPRFVAETLGRHLADRPPDSDTLVVVCSEGRAIAIWKLSQPSVEPHRPPGRPRSRGTYAARPTAYHISLMRAAGANVKEIQQQLGHLSPVVTLSVYTHLFEGALDPVMERLDDEHRRLMSPA